MHVERIDSDDVQGLLDGKCSIFPKMDGSNMGVYSEDGEMRMMSRNKEITYTEEPFAVFARSHKNIARFVRDFPGLRLYGEWMVPHTVKSYIPEVWGRWFVFDIMVESPGSEYTYMDKDRNERHLDCRDLEYIPYDDYVPLLEAYGIEYVDRICEEESPSLERLGEIADKEDTWMMADGCGEGIVVKRYGYSNPYGRSIWAKVINSEYSKFKVESRKLKMEAKLAGGSAEYKIARTYVTPDVVNKEYDRILADKGVVYPGQLLGTMFHVLVKENMWDALKKFRVVEINFRTLRRECDQRVKMTRPEVFGLSSLDVASFRELDDIE